MPRIDLAQTIKQVTFPDEVWEWLDLLGDAIASTQQQAMAQDESFLADTPYKKLLLCAINRDIATLTTVYILLRWEQIHQAAAHVRLLCENLITLICISEDIVTRVSLFQDFSHVESYKHVEAILKWEASGARPEYVKQLEALLLQLQEDRDRVIVNYTQTDRKVRKRERSTWCEISIAEQARQCGTGLNRIYEIVYSQLSAYIHGSAWSLRRQVSYSRKHYNSQVVLNDIATIVRTALVVWEEWAKFCDEQLGWSLNGTLPAVATRLEELDTKLSCREAGA